MRDRRYRWLLRLLPRTFREDYEREIVRAWRDELDDAPRADHGRVWRRAVKDTLRAAPREHLSSWLHNLRMASRSLWKARGFTATAVATLALGTGATAAVFSLLNAVLLRPLPWDGADAVGLIWAVSPAGQRTWLSPPEVAEIGADVKSVAGVAGFTDLQFAYAAAPVAREADAIAVSHNFFRVLGVTPVIGRDFAPEDDHRTAAKSVVLSHAFWRSQLGADRSIIGRTMRLNDEPYVVLGVLPEIFEWLPASSVLPGRVDVWVALEPHLISRDRNVRFVHAIARLRSGSTFGSATAELSAYAARAQAQFGAAYQGGRWTFELVSFKDDVLKNARPALLLLFALVMLVLVMACTNVANLLLVRGEARRAEIAVRAALGAGPARLAGELMAEAVVLATLAGVAGLACALLVPRLFAVLGPAAIPRMDGVGVDRNVAIAIVGLVLVTSALAGFFPLLDRLRCQRADGLRDRSGGRSVRAVRIGRLLVGVQTALATAVVVSTLFFAFTFQRLQRVELGFDPDRLLTLRASVLSPQPGVSATQFFEESSAAIARVPGVVSVGAVSQLPLSGTLLGSTFLDGAGGDARRIDADVRGVTPSYFAALGIPVLQGRAFAPHDTMDSTRVVVVDETFARALDPTGHVVGRRVRWFRQPDVELEIAGVVGGVRHRRPEGAPVPTVYRPIAQYPRTSMYFAIRTGGEPARVTDAVAAAIASVSRMHPVADVATMEQRVAAATARARASVTLTAILAALALALGSIGLYGVISFGVAQRGREFGVRLALGATAGRVRGMVLRDGFVVMLGGLAAGIFGGFAIARAAGSLLYGISSGNPLPYAAAAVIVVGCGGIAFSIPAWRASAVNPVTALRRD